MSSKQEGDSIIQIQQRLYPATPKSHRIYQTRSSCLEITRQPVQTRPAEPTSGLEARTSKASSQINAITKQGIEFLCRVQAFEFWSTGFNEPVYILDTTNIIKSVHPGSRPVYTAAVSEFIPDASGTVEYYHDISNMLYSRYSSNQEGTIKTDNRPLKVHHQHRIMARQQLALGMASRHLHRTLTTSSNKLLKQHRKL